MTYYYYDFMLTSDLDKSSALGPLPWGLCALT